MTMYRVLALAAAVITLQGCVSNRSAHGYVLERGESGLDAIVGVDSKESVLAKYGEPSLIGTFDRNAWYYVSALDASRAFFRPETTARSVVGFHFDGEGKVERVESIDLADAVDLKIDSKTTPTRGKELGFWEQLLGNVGQLPAGGLGGPGGGAPN